MLLVSSHKANQVSHIMLFFSKTFWIYKNFPRAVTKQQPGSLSCFVKKLGSLSQQKARPFFIIKEFQL